MDGQLAVHKKKQNRLIRFSNTLKTQTETKSNVATKTRTTP